MDNSVDIKIISCGNCGDKNLLKINGKLIHIFST